MPPAWVTWNRGFPLVSTCLRGLKAGRWRGLSVTLPCGASPPPDAILRRTLLVRLPIAELNMLPQAEGPGVPEWARMGGMCWPLTIPGPCGLPDVRWRLMLHDLPFILKKPRGQDGQISSGTTESFQAKSSKLSMVWVISLFKRINAGSFKGKNESQSL